MLKTFVAAACAALALAGMGATAQAADISGAGATFPAPVYAKWAETYKAQTGRRPELPGHRLGRRHQADQGQDRRCSAPPTSR